LPFCIFFIYHGKPKWKIPLNFKALFKDIPTFDPYIPDFEYILRDLSKYEFSDLLNDNNLILQVYLLISKYIFTIEFTEKLVEILSVSSGLDKTKTGKDYIKIIIEYLIKGTEKMTEKQLEFNMIKK